MQMIVAKEELAKWQDLKLKRDQVFAENRELNFELLRLDEHTKNFTRKYE